MQIVSDIFSILDSELPERWQWCTTYYMFGKNRSSVFVDYGFSTDKTKIEDGFTLNRESKSLIKSLREEIALKPTVQPTHIELTIECTGAFNTVIGYGDPNWDPAPRPWPDDITAKEYTYTKAWPNGMSEEARSIMEDPRSLIGYD